MGLTISWERPSKTKEEKTAGSLATTGRALILLSFLVFSDGENLVFFAWLAVAMLLIHPLYVVIYWHGIRVRRPEMVILAVIALALAALYVRAIFLF